MRAGWRIAELDDAEESIDLWLTATDGLPGETYEVRRDGYTMLAMEVRTDDGYIVTHCRCQRAETFTGTGLTSGRGQCRQSGKELFRPI